MSGCEPILSHNNIYKNIKIKPEEMMRSQSLNKLSHDVMYYRVIECNKIIDTKSRNYPSMLHRGVSDGAIFPL